MSQFFSIPNPVLIPSFWSALQSWSNPNPKNTLQFGSSPIQAQPNAHLWSN